MFPTLPLLFGFPRGLDATCGGESFVERATGVSVTLSAMHDAYRSIKLADTVPRGCFSKNRHMARIHLTAGTSLSALPLYQQSNVRSSMVSACSSLTAVCLPVYSP